MGCNVVKTEGSPVLKHDDNRAGFHKSYQLLTKLGEGSHGVVYLACPSGCSEEQYAVKVVDHDTSSGIALAESKTRMKKEIEVLQMISDGEHCVRVACFYDEGSIAYIVMERCEESLPDALQKASAVETPLVANCVKMMLQALCHIHALGIVHRDVKPANFLVKGSVNKRYSVKLCDFGLATGVPGTHGRPILWEECGTLPFCAPEMLNSLGYGTRADVWSLGVVVHAFLLGKYVYMPRPLTLQNIKASIKGDSPTPSWKPACGLSSSHITQDMLSFMQVLLNRDPLARFSAHEALKHNWLRSAVRRPSQGNECVSLKPMLDAAQKLGAFTPNGASTVSAIDRKLRSFQAQYGHALPRIGMG